MNLEKVMKAVEENPNNYELGKVIRKMYWEYQDIDSEEEIDKVTTPMGCTIEGLNEMEHKGLSSSLIQGMVTSFKKINTIKEEQI